MLSEMRAWAISLLALTTGCGSAATPPSSSDSTQDSTSQEVATKSAAEPTSAQPTSETPELTQTKSEEPTDSATGAGDLREHQLTPQVRSGRRLRAIYIGGDDGSIAARHVELLWDAQLTAYCELSLIEAKDPVVGDRIYCLPLMGERTRCSPRTYRDAECKHEALIAGEDFDDFKPAFFRFLEKDESDPDCGDPRAEIYAVAKFDPSEVKVYYWKDEDGECHEREAYAHSYFVELGDPVPLDRFASGTYAIE